MLGKRLKTYRMNKKISQKKIGELVDRDIQTIRSWEDGKSEPKASELVKLSDFYVFLWMKCAEEKRQYLIKKFKYK